MYRDVLPIFRPTCKIVLKAARLGDVLGTVPGNIFLPPDNLHPGAPELGEEPAPELRRRVHRPPAAAVDHGIRTLDETVQMQRPRTMGLDRPKRTFTQVCDRKVNCLDSCQRVMAFSPECHGSEVVPGLRFKEVCVGGIELRVQLAFSFVF